ncbi:hypothetical protein MP228_007150 [Amoeboaphelidium protococcarum]|nr:hypothetical protein MP228_007150 [Amoeboaphelidium protococcarum]
MSQLSTANYSQHLTQQTQLVGTQQTQHSTRDTQELNCAWAKLVGHQTHLLFENCVIIGRHRTCQIRINDLFVSNNHCSVQRGADGIVSLTDLSTNGTFVNGIQVGKGNHVPLQHNDHIELLKGRIFFIFLDLMDSKMMSDSVNDLAACQEKYYVLNKVLGEGNFATVQLAIQKGSMQRAACKIIQKSKLDLHINKKQFQHLRNEVQVLQSINHPNLVQLLDVYETDKSIYLMLEYVGDGGELFTRLQSRIELYEQVSDDLKPRTYPGLDPLEVQFVFYQLLLGTQYLHEHDISHRDLKLENVLLETNDRFTRVCITDFGLSKIQSNKTRLQTMCGTLIYVAPEVLMNTKEDSGYSNKCDCWSLGVILYMLASASMPFLDGGDDQQLKYLITRGIYDFDDPVWDLFDPQITDLISKLLIVDVGMRYSIRQALDHPWVQSDKFKLSRLYESVTLKSQSEVATDDELYANTEIDTSRNIIYY